MYIRTCTYMHANAYLPICVTWICSKSTNESRYVTVAVYDNYGKLPSQPSRLSHRPDMRQGQVHVRTKVGDWDSSVRLLW